MHIYLFKTYEYHYRSNCIKRVYNGARSKVEFLNANIKICVSFVILEMNIVIQR